MEGAGIRQQCIIIPYVLKKCYALIFAVAKAVSIPKALTLDTFLLEIRLWSHALWLYFCVSVGEVVPDSVAW